MGKILKNLNTTLDEVMNKGADIADPLLSLINDGDGVIKDLPIVKYLAMCIDFYNSAARRKFERNVQAFLESARSGFIDSGFTEIKLKDDEFREEFEDTLLRVSSNMK